MFSIRVERVFPATHAVTIRGVDEEPHAHDWRVRVTLEAASLDEDGLLCDFHDLEQKLDTVLSQFHGVDLNKTAPFDELNPSAENVAWHLATTLEPGLPAGVGSITVAVTEAPGCEAAFRIECS
ncbi:MAG: 6-carboxytetrahydropterin synthase [Phycisphaerales bacterium]|nr:6-carboxytetrahydropterin synthase [Phycisphaerales bacterium]